MNVLLIEEIKKQIGEPSKEGYTDEQQQAFKSAVESRVKLIHEKAEPWAYIAIPIFSCSGQIFAGKGSDGAEIQWQVLTPECKQYGNQRQQLFRFSSPLLEVTAINLAADLSTSAELRLYRDGTLNEREISQDELVQIQVADDDDLLEAEVDENTDAPTSLLPPPRPE